MSTNTDTPTVDDALRWTEWLCIRSEHGDGMTEHRDDMERLMLDLLYAVVNLRRNEGVPVEIVHNIHSVNVFFAGVMTQFLEQEREA